MTNNTHSTGTQLSLEELLALSGIPNTAKPDIKEVSLFEARFVNGQVELTPVEQERVPIPNPTPVPASVPSPIYAPTGRKVCRISESVIRRILADKMDSPKVPDLSIIYSVADKSAAEVFYKDIFFYGEVSLIADLQESLKKLHISFKLVVPTDLGFAEYIIAVNGKVKPANDLASPVVAEAASKKLMAPAGGGFTVVFKTTGKGAWFHDFKNMEEVSAYLGKKGFAELVHYKDIWMKGGVSFAKVGPYLTVDEKKNYTFKK